MFDSLTYSIRRIPSVSAALLFATLGLASPATVTAGEGYRVGTCDWTIRMAGQLEAFDFARKAGLEGLQFSFSEPGQNIDLR